MEAECKNCKNNYTIGPNDLAFYERMNVPTPKFCIECRYIKRLINRNEWNLYKRNCDLCKKNIISIYKNDAIFPVYCHECWWSDKWDAQKYAKDFDFNKPFFVQFKELHDLVPHVALVGSNNVNCDYSNQSEDNKECYMVSATNRSEKCMYGNWFQGDCFYSLDCYMIEKSEYCYECMNSARCSKCAYLENCFDCVSVYFSTDCKGCSNCFGCVNLRNKSNCWFNEQLTKEEYKKRLDGFVWNRENIKETIEKISTFSLTFPRKFYNGSNNINSSGDYLENTASTKQSFNSRHSKNNAYLQDAWEANECQDATEILSNEFSYQIQGCAYVRNSISLRSSFHMSDCYYCDMCNTLTDCFGCIGLKQKNYYILNKKYSKEEYLALKEKIIKHMKETEEWGEFFDPNIISPFAYNECVAYDYFPLSKEEAIKAGYQWYDRPARNYSTTMETKNIPETISETSQKILGEIIKCSSQNKDNNIPPNCSTAFRVMPLELNFYKIMNLPIPDKCPTCRRETRFSRRNSRKLWARKCMCTNNKHFHGDNSCEINFETSYSPDRPEIIYCEKCYQQEVY